jgi:hypothetical protein
MVASFRYGPVEGGKVGPLTFSEETAMGEKRVWRKSPHSGYNNSCVEVATAVDKAGQTCVLLRDTKNRRGFCYQFSHDEWRAFTGDIKNNKFDNLTQKCTDNGVPEPAAMQPGSAASISL